MGNRRGNGHRQADRTASAVRRPGRMPGDVNDMVRFRAAESLREAREALRRVDGPLRRYPAAGLPAVAEAARRLTSAVVELERLAAEHLDAS